METKLQKLETTSEKTEFAEPIHSESSNQETATTSEKTNLQIRALQKTPAEKLKHKYLATLTKKYYTKTETKLQKLETTSEQREFASSSIRKVLTKRQTIHQRRRNLQIRALQNHFQRTS